MESWNDGVKSGESSIEQKPDTRCEGDGCQRKSEAVEKESRTSRDQTDMTDHRCLQV